MTLPASWVQIPVTYAGDFYPSGAALAGKRLKIEPLTTVLSDGEVASPEAVTLTLDEDGALPDGTTLPSVNDTEREVEGVYYRVTEQWAGARESFIMLLPYNVATFNIGTAAPQVPPGDYEDTKGPPGPPGNFISSFEGAWDIATTYSTGALVTDGGASWLALVGSTGVTPVEGATWTQVAAPGEEGPQGEPGDPGAAATVAVGTTTTGAAGTDAAVANSGSSSAAVFDFTIPRGDTGAQGDPGNDGAAATIAVGTVTTGAAGSAAEVSNAGTPAAAVLDFTIPRGDKGDQGEQGPAGADGDSATITVYTDESAFNAATPGPLEIAVLTDA